MDPIASDTAAAEPVNGDGQGESADPSGPGPADDAYLWLRWAANILGFMAFAAGVAAIILPVVDLTQRQPLLALLHFAEAVAAVVLLAGFAQSMTILLEIRRQIRAIEGRLGAMRPGLSHASGPAAP